MGVDAGGDRRRGRGSFGVNLWALWRPIVTSGAFVVEFCGSV